MSEVKITPKEGISELIIREGQALELKPDKAIKITGTLGAPFQFLSGKAEIFEDSKMHLQIFKDSGRLELHINDQSPYNEHIIIGSLTKDSVIGQFAINSEKRWSVRDFLKFIKTMRFYFASREAHTALVESIQKWSVKVERVIVEHNDHKGNSNFQLETKVNAVDGLVSKFDLNVPIFQGFPKVKFTVEIGLDPKNTEVQIFLISDDLIELEVSNREKLIDDEIKSFDPFTFSKVVVS